MLAFRPLLRQTRQRGSGLSRIAVRTQHNINGPHKEYFQNPNQHYYPVHETSHSPAQVQQPQNASYRPSRIIRFVRSSLWTIIFLHLGFVTGAALITWEYLQPPYEKGSEEDLELQEDILDTLDTCAIVESLRDEGWLEQDAFVPPLGEDGRQGEHLLHQTLHSVQGIHMKVFRHTSDVYTIVVFYPGFGCEGWPDTIHGGVISSLFVDSIEKHLSKLVQDPSMVSQLLTVSNVHIDFKRPIRPGDIYTILVTPASVTSRLLEEAPSDLGMDQGQPVWHIKVTAHLLNMEAAPRISIDVDPYTKAENHTVEIPSRSAREPAYAVANADIYVPSEEDPQKILEKEGLGGGQAKNDLFKQLGAAMQGGIELNNKTDDNGETSKDSNSEDGND